MSVSCSPVPAITSLSGFSLTPHLCGGKTLVPKFLLINPTGDGFHFAYTLFTQRERFATLICSWLLDVS